MGVGERFDFFGHFLALFWAIFAIFLDFGPIFEQFFPNA